MCANYPSQARGSLLGLGLAKQMMYYPRIPRMENGWGATSKQQLRTTWATWLDDCMTGEVLD